MKEMPWGDFEYLCLHILEINGIINFSPTEKNQKGIDFCALLELDRYSLPGILLKGCRVKIVGQAKRFSREIGEGLVRNFKTFLEDVQEPKRDVIEKLPKWFKEIKSPILGIFLTTSKFTKGAIKYAQKEGIILKDGEQILEDLIKSPDSGKWVSTVENGKFIFNKNAFFDFFKNFGKEIL
uniref:Restriction endonuclease n=1 Tax=candidate division WOR-3 bacterium TaxID=2052148 RepID=A0A7C3URU7_UNCW3